MQRRTALKRLLGGVPLAAAAVGAARGPERKPAPRPAAARTDVGLAIYSLSSRGRLDRARGRPPLDAALLLEHAARLGAGGIQAPLGARPGADSDRLRRRAEELGLWVEGIARLPSDRADVERFAAELRAAARAGASVARVVMLPGRRYERFGSRAEFLAALERGRRSLELAGPIAARQKVRLALENHKGQRVGERIAELERLSSEWVGACVDTGNSIALCEDALRAVRAFAPRAFAVHLKDQAMAECEDGFLLADARLGEGVLDLAAMVEALRSARPAIRFTLELITRDPLRVPCLTERYWRTMPDVPASDLARALRAARRGRAESLLHASRLSLEERARLEEENVRASLDHARRELGL